VPLYEKFHDLKVWDEEPTQGYAPQLRPQAWREERTVTRNLTLHYDRMMLLLDPTPLARGLVRKKVEVVNYPDGRFAVQFNGAVLVFKVSATTSWQPRWWGARAARQRRAWRTARLALPSA
jgi:hypothetical protein